MTIFNQVMGVLAVEEAVPNVAEALSATTDGCLPYLGEGDLASPTGLDYLYDGSQGRAPGTQANQKRTTPNGRSRASEFKCLPRGRGTLYSASLKPPNEVFRWLKAAGYEWTYSATPTPQWTATPKAAGQGTTLTVRENMQGAKHDLAGVLADFNSEAKGLGVPVWSFPFRGVAALPATEALPVVTYDFAAILPPVASAVLPVLGDFILPELRSVSFKQNRKYDTARTNQRLAGGHAGFVDGATGPMFEVEIAQTSRVLTPFHDANGLDPEALMAAATSIPISFTYGTVQYNRWKIGSAQSQLVSVQPGNDGGLATWVLGFAPHPSTPALNDTHYILFN